MTAVESFIVQAQLERSSFRCFWHLDENFDGELVVLVGVGAPLYAEAGVDDVAEIDGDGVFLKQEPKRTSLLYQGWPKPFPCFDSSLCNNDLDRLSIFASTSTSVLTLKLSRSHFPSLLIRQLGLQTQAS
jgi:hypothetical protein